MNIRKTILIVSLLGVLAQLKAQVTMNFIPTIHGQRLDGLYFVQLVNASAVAMTGTLRIVVREADGREIVQITTPKVMLNPRVNQLDKNAFSKSMVRFGTGYAATIVQQTGKFPEGEVEYCFEFISEQKQGTDNNIFQNCFEHFIQPLTPLSLIYPADGDELCITRPSFLWQPPLPLQPNTKFRVIVVEKGADEPAVLAMSNNLPIVNQAGIAGNTILYPAGSPDLQQGRHYAWQVIAYNGNAILSKSEIWTFTMKCDSPDVTEKQDSYRELKEVPENNYYYAQGKLLFTYMNPYQEGNLEYSIINLEDPGQNPRKLPKIKIKTGLNKIDLDLRKMKLTEGNHYLLRVKRNMGRWLVLRFVYMEPIEE